MSNFPERWVMDLLFDSTNPREIDAKESHCFELFLKVVGTSVKIVTGSYKLLQKRVKLWRNTASIISGTLL